MFNSGNMSVLYALDMLEFHNSLTFDQLCGNVKKDLYMFL